MKLRDYLKSMETTRVKFAKAAGTKAVYLTHIANGHRKPSFKLTHRIEKATGGKVSRHDLRPDIFGKSA